MKKVISKILGVLLGTLVVVYISGCGKDTAYYIGTGSTEDTEISTESEEGLQKEVQSSDGDGEETLLYIYVCGAVQNPGVYTMPEGSRICDVFEKAGGLTEDAAEDYWNQAKILTDGEMLYVPTLQEVEDRALSRDEANTNEENDNKVNINTASKDELMTIPGIGETKAIAIIAYREEKGFFSSIEEVKNVEGIKDGVFTKMKDYIEID